MITNNIYLLQVTLTWGLLYLFYLIFLGRETFFRTNRFYLLGALLMGLFLPFAQAILQQAAVGVQVVQLPTITITHASFELAPNESVPNLFGVINWLSVIYWVGFGLMSMKVLRDLIGIAWLIRDNRKEKKDGLTTIHIERDMAPFSFFNCLFVFDKAHFSQEEWGQILLHEKTHIEQLHSFDILFTEVLKIIFWWNPLVYLYQRSLREVHEYEADHAVEKEKNIKQYGLLLMKQSLSGNQVAVANSFINSQLKKRIIMMTKKRSNSLAKLRYVWSLPLLLILFFISFSGQALAQKVRENIRTIETDTIFTVDPDTYDETMKIIKSSYYKNETLESPAILSSCRNVGGVEQKEKCSQQKLLKTLMQHIKYPKAAYDQNKEGMVVVKIYIRPYTNSQGNGTFIGYEVIKDPGLGMADEVIRALHEVDMKWDAGQVDGTRVESAFVLPIKFAIDKATEPLTDDAIRSNASKKGFSDIKINWEGTSMDVSFVQEKYVPVSVTAYSMGGGLIDGSVFTYDEKPTEDKPHQLHIELEGIYDNIILLRFSEPNGNVFVKKVVRLR